MTITDGQWGDYPHARPAPAPRVLARLAGWALACGAAELTIAAIVWRLFA